MKLFYQFYIVATFFCAVMFSVDNSEWTRNGDFLPTRIQAQQDAVSLICHSKTRQNPENNVGLMTLARYKNQEMILSIKLHLYCRQFENYKPKYCC